MTACTRSNMCLTCLLISSLVIESHALKTAIFNPAKVVVGGGGLSPNVVFEVVPEGFNGAEVG